MRIYLYDIVKRKDIQLNLKPEYSFVTDDLYVVFITKNFTVELGNGKQSSPYNEFYFKKVNHIVSANITYEGYEHCLTIGYHLSSNNLVPFLIDEVSESEMLTFATSEEAYFGNYSKETVLFNYKEYSELMELGLEKLSFREYVKKIVDGKIDKMQYELYTIPNIGSNDFISKKGLEVFFEEELRKMKLKK
jgi:hypothetical protein